jgi:hypothetical protein
MVALSFVSAIGNGAGECEFGREAEKPFRCWNFFITAGFWECSPGERAVIAPDNL